MFEKRFFIGDNNYQVYACRSWYDILKDTYILMPLNLLYFPLNVIQGLWSLLIIEEYLLALTFLFLYAPLWFLVLVFICFLNFLSGPFDAIYAAGDEYF